MSTTFGTMNETLCTSSSSEWKQLYEQTIEACFGFSDATAVTVTTNNLTSNTSYAAAVDHYLAPKACISKSIRRRSRASKRTPVTLLNADAKNFRSLVQQFTGCRRRSTSISFSKNPRGPVNINFAHVNPKNDHHHHHNYTCHSDHASILPQPGTNDCWKSQLLQPQEKHEHHHHQQHDDEYQQRASNEEQEGEFSFDSITSTDHDDLFPQGFVMDDLYFLT
ncbi:hypothetical protein GOBAR_AA29893 [Gossypium barbadense]|uniref:VQ domain-containing protein n=3 Tax=Gossypium TaxID=3633 RepID=A0A2P5WI78_GOSBA|nr:hypothetical protein GOBAR_AA29893 [Gossypium barbadense]TYG88828.1 hypothetical protein ES288_A12G051700v1 [Gossypium darwinii]